MTNKGVEPLESSLIEINSERIARSFTNSAIRRRTASCTESRPRQRERERGTERYKQIATFKLIKMIKVMKRSDWVDTLVVRLTVDIEAVKEDNSISLATETKRKLN
jgi:hypothetical protein